MVTSNSRLAYTDCFGILDQAIADSKGIRIKFASMEQARLFRLRLHNARRIDRRDSIQIYGEDHPMSGKSIYDGLVIRIRKESNDVWWLRIERIDAITYEVESLSETPQPPIPPEQPKVVPMKRRV